MGAFLLQKAGSFIPIVQLYSFIKSSFPALLMVKLLLTVPKSFFEYPFCRIPLIGTRNTRHLNATVMV